MLNQLASNLADQVAERKSVIIYKEFDNVVTEVDEMGRQSMKTNEINEQISNQIHDIGSGSN